MTQITIFKTISGETRNMTFSNKSFKKIDSPTELRMTELRTTQLSTTELRTTQLRTTQLRTTQL
jgi:hypothetical protein